MSDKFCKSILGKKWLNFDSKKNYLFPVVKVSKIPEKHSALELNTIRTSKDIALILVSLALNTFILMKQTYELF